MSHFSKIKTNITDLNVLIKTIGQLGFDYQFVSSTDNCFYTHEENKNNDLLVYQINKYGNKNHVFTFIWNVSEYNLVVDLELWSLSIDFNYLFDHLLQQYAYNMIMNTSSILGFQKVKEQLNYDGSIKLTLQKWDNS
uniref:hypothetical protein n=1 Tax=Pterosiphonia complanata TaxID=884089 RepID=UPI0022FD8CB3|nr:hypothetical protein PNW47_pgp168 [Pterosiphonia complanata]WAX03027.1 hypothetical protein [Pterosiphonia complanata]